MVRSMNRQDNPEVRIKKNRTEPIAVRKIGTVCPICCSQMECCYDPRF